MKIVIQRVQQAHVTVDDAIVGEIKQGLLLFVGLETSDTQNDIEKAATKILGLRIFDDEAGIMNKSIMDVGGQILSVSQFTLAADTRKGNRPSYINAMAPEDARLMYCDFNEMIRKEGVYVAEGVFQADMQVLLQNDGPVTILLEIKHGKVC